MVTLLLLLALWLLSSLYKIWRDTLHYLPLDARLSQVMKEDMK